MLLDAISAVIQNSWKMLTSVQVPGLDISFAALFLGLFLVSTGMTFLSAVLGFGFGGISNLGYFTSGNAGANASYRSSRNSKAKISKERQHDQV